MVRLVESTVFNGRAGWVIRGLVTARVEWEDA